MENQRKNIIWVLWLTLAWIIGSAYVYTCLIKGFCSETSEKEKVEVIQEQEDIYNEEDFKTMSLNKDKKEEKNNSLEEEVIEKKKFEKRTIKCFTHINSTMKIGSIKNIKSEVEKLEIFLNKYYNANLEVDGVFDEDDKEAVVEFQNIKSLESDGIVGPKTLRIINAVYCVKNEKKN